MKYSNEELSLIKECLELGCSYKDIATFIYEDFGINRTTLALQNKCFKLGWKSISKVKTNTQFINEIKILTSNIEILDKYINNYTKIKCKCLVHDHVWSITPNNLLAGKGCQKCAGNNEKKSHDQFMKEINNINKNIEILDKYTTNKTKIKCKCNVDKYIWSVTPNSLLNGSGCPKCSYRNAAGYYSQLTKEQADNLGYPLYLYNVILQYKDEIFCKYGLTKRSNKQRYNEYKPYIVVEELSFEKYDAWTAICKEKELKSNYTPQIKFCGYTECYLRAH